jgi:HD superfamily phosphohydrolase
MKNLKSTNKGFPDPIYQSILFGERINPPSGYLDEFDGEHLKGITFPRSDSVIGSADFLRIKHLHQNGIALLSFPSATHTAFSHAIGTWWLAHLAGERIKVYDDNDKHAISLKSWLMDHSLYAELVTASLLNSIGQPPVPFPFLPSEGDDQLMQLFRDKSDLLILKNTELSRQWSSTAAGKFGTEIGTISQILETNGLSEADIKKISSIMDKEKGNQNSDLGVRIAWDLLNGTIDLNSIDALLRDSYFTGIRQTSVNVNSLLGNLSLYVNSGNNEYKWIIGRDGIPQCENILFNKKQLNALVIHNSEVIANYGLMLGSVRSHLQIVSDSEHESEIMKMSLMDDSELFFYLRKSESADAIRYSNDLTNSTPFGLLYRFSRGKMSPNRLMDLRNRMKEIMSNYDYSSGFILLFDSGFWSDTPEGNPAWLDPKFLHSSKDGQISRMDDEYRYEYNKIFLPNFHYMWLMAKSNSDETNKAVMLLKNYLQEC